MDLNLSHQDSTFKTTARVISSHIGMGMGFVFEETPLEQAEVLVQWLGLDDNVERRPAAAPAAIAAQADSSDHNLMLNLIRLLRSKGILTEADELALHFGRLL